MFYNHITAQTNNFADFLFLSLVSSFHIFHKTDMASVFCVYPHCSHAFVTYVFCALIGQTVEPMLFQRN